MKNKKTTWKEGFAKDSKYSETCKAGEGITKIQIIVLLIQRNVTGKYSRILFSIKT